MNEIRRPAAVGIDNCSMRLTTNAKPEMSNSSAAAAKRARHIASAAAAVATMPSAR